MPSAETARTMRPRGDMACRAPIDYTCVWKTSEKASTAFVRSVEASCMDSRARSTAMTTASGSDGLAGGQVLRGLGGVVLDAFELVELVGEDRAEARAAARGRRGAGGAGARGAVDRADVPVGARR